MKFGKYVFELRKGLGIGLREFCILSNYDPSTWSKIERGLMPAPKNYHKLRLVAWLLGLKEETKEWALFMDLAELSRGNLPKDMLNDEELVKTLPAFFCAMREVRPTSAEIDRLINDFRKTRL